MGTRNSNHRRLATAAVHLLLLANMVLSISILICVCLISSMVHMVDGRIVLPVVRWSQPSRGTFASLLALRGGKGGKDNADDDDAIDQQVEHALDDQDSSSDVNEDNENESESEEHDTNFGNERSIPLVKTITSIWHKTPPITQAYVGGSLLITALSFFLNKNQWPDILHFKWSAILTGQVWRLVSAFLYFGQLDLFYPLTMQFVWQHMAQLEKMNYSKPEEFLVMLVFGAASLISVYTALGISTRFLGHNLATFFVYIWSRVFEGSDVNFMDLFTLKAELLPWFFCAQTFFLEREIPFADLIGILVGHVYYYLKQKDGLKAPDRVRMWFQSERMQAKYAAFKSDFE